MEQSSVIQHSLDCTRESCGSNTTAENAWTVPGKGDDHGSPGGYLLRPTQTGSLGPLEALVSSVPYSKAPCGEAQGPGRLGYQSEIVARKHAVGAESSDVLAAP